MAELENREIIIKENVLILNDVELSLVFKLISNISGAEAVRKYKCNENEAACLYPLYSVLKNG